MVSYRNLNLFECRVLFWIFMLYSHKLDQEQAEDLKRPTHMLMRHFSVVRKLEARVLELMLLLSASTSLEPSDQKLRKTIKMTPSLLAKLTWIELRAPQLSKLKNNYLRRKLFSKNKNKLHWPNPRLESKRCFKWMLKE